MKHYTLLSAALLFAVNLFAQNTTRQPIPVTAASDSSSMPAERIYETYEIEKLPMFPGGEVALHKYLRDSLTFPPITRESNMPGTIAVSFVVGKDGTISGIKTLKDPGNGFAEEMIRAIKSMPSWTPGEVNGKAIAVKFTLPYRVCFRE